MKPVELDYIEKNGILFPNIQISNNPEADKCPVGKYGMMWLRFMKEFHNKEYEYHFIEGDLIETAHKINDETHEMIENMLNYKSTSMDRFITEENVVKEMVLKIR